MTENELMVFRKAELNKIRRIKSEIRKNKQAKLCIEKFKKMYGEKYQYSEEDFLSSNNLITVTCPTHGVFEVSIQSHLRGVECPHCNPPLRSQKGNPSLRREKKESSIQHSLAYKRERKHKDKHFNNSEEYERRMFLRINDPDAYNKEIQSKGEYAVESFLDKNNIEFVKQWRVRNEYSFCKYKFMYADFYLPEQNMVIEFNGKQHYEPIDYFGGKRMFKIQQNRDKAMRMYCKDNCIELMEISYLEENDIDKILESRLKSNTII